MTRRRGFFWPLVLIAIGLVALLSNYGFISGVSLVALLGLWPLLLVLLGIDIAFARRWPIATLAADVAIIALGLSLVAFQPALVGPAFGFGFPASGCDRDGGQPSISVPRGTATSLHLRFSGGAGRFSVAGGASDLVNATSTGNGLRVSSRATLVSPGGLADVRIDECSARPRTFGTGGTDVDVRVARDVPSSITIDAGAGTFTIDLRDVRLTEATLNVGAGEALLILPKPSGDVPIHVSAGASSITVQVPDGVEARVTATGGLVSISGNSETPGYASARDRVTVTITAGAGSVRVR